ncbi:MAG: response regulator [Spirochaetales bacterium]|nr:response regulator [Spirochaetales bacterium]
MKSNNRDFTRRRTAFKKMFLDPLARVSDTETVEKSRILSFIQIHLFLAGLGVMITSFVLGVQPNHNFYTICATVAGIAFCYLLNRRGLYMISGCLLILITSVSLFIFSIPGNIDFLAVKGMLLLFFPLISAYYFMNTKQGLLVNGVLLFEFILFIVLFYGQLKPEIYTYFAIFIGISLHVVLFTAQRNIIEQVRIAELQQLKEQYLSLTRNIPDIIARFDKDARYLFISDQVREIAGLQPETFIGKTNREVGLPEEVAAESIRVLKLVFATGKPSHDVFQVPVPNGLLVIEARTYPEYDEDRNIVSVLSVLKDITKQFHLEEQLRQTQKMEAIGQLAGGIAHDFNNQLTGIMGLSELLRFRLKDNTELSDYAENIFLSAKHAAETTKNLLSFARKDRIKSDLVDIHKIIDEILSLLEHSVDKRILLSRNLAANHSMISGDASQLYNALLNIAINACDAMPTGGSLSISTTLRNTSFEKTFPLTHVLPAGEYIVVEIKDSGVGIEEAIRKHIFEPFYTTKKTGKGTGLGLSAAYNIVNSHQGIIDLDSRVGQGTSFFVFLPVQISTSVVVNAIEDPAPPGMGKGKILLVDDEAIVARTISKMLMWMGYDVVYFKNSREAVDYYKQQWEEISLVVMDLMMPVMSGTDVFTLIKKINPACRVLIVSGYSMHNEPEVLLRQGADDFLHKPFKLTELAEKISAILQKKKGSGL